MLCALLAMGDLASADVYSKMEASFSISNLATDPFDYAQTDVRVQITQPDSTTNSLPAFFMAARRGGCAIRRRSPASTR